MPPSVESNVLDRVILSWPKNLTDQNHVKPAGTRRSWIQLVRCGAFVSNRYGKFEITKQDLATMYQNFGNITPKSPTELPIDYDHLSMDPKKPGDGIAAGWMKKLELREDGEELWAEVEWTVDGASRIEKQEYRFVSPSFVKNHTHKDGKKIGTTLLAAAITNHPFLEGMKALTLYNFGALGDLALNEKAGESAVLHLAEIGQRVTFSDDAEATPELTDEERAQTFVVKAVGGGQGDDAFVQLESVAGKSYGWYPMKHLAPAPAPEKEENMSKNTAVQMLSADQQLIALADEILKERPEISLADAYIAAGRRRVDLAEARRTEIGVVADESPADAPVLSLSVRDGETFDALCLRYAAEKYISLREAIPIVSAAHPKLAEAYGRGEAVA